MEFNQINSTGPIKRLHSTEYCYTNTVILLTIKLSSDVQLLTIKLIFQNHHSISVTLQHCQALRLRFLMYILFGFLGIHLKAKRFIGL